MGNSIYSVNQFWTLIDKKRATVKSQLYKYYKDYINGIEPNPMAFLCSSRYKLLSRIREWLIHSDADRVVTYHEGQLHLLYNGVFIYPNGKASYVEYNEPGGFVGIFILIVI